MSHFQRLVRFETERGEICFGEAPSSDIKVGDSVQVYGGNEPWALSANGGQARIAKILCPLPSTPMIYGIGLNYKAHIAEAGFPVPEFPTVFTKPPDALNGPYENILFPSESWNMDYEGELCVVIGKDCKDVGEDEDPLDYVLGYACGNDASARYWQMPARSGNQHGYAKSFDGFAPIGPVLVSPALVPCLDEVDLTTRVNGEVRQQTSVGDLLFDTGSLICHLSTGTTLRPGTVIMTGTPSGVAAFMQPPSWLHDGDQVEVSISGLGALNNVYKLKTKA
ncbi:hypothetical protein OPT61_g1121 [Boeremia exigua]|uniref:Uncharacterized protein n=1 Tax=Boeremia exigua TaxID=749465 RepID=A0ACC2IRB1_9PLEO|nr:hypothetical protein OPT61_g1121 [Boeremia exigua]